MTVFALTALDITTKAFSAVKTQSSLSQRASRCLPGESGPYTFPSLLLGTHHFASQQYLVLADFKSVGGLTFFGSQD